MIHHISIPALNPLHVANVLAELWEDGYVTSFICPGSYIVLAGDEYGTAIEVYPHGTELVPGNIEVNSNGTELIPSHDNDQVKFSQNQSASAANYTAVHAAISVPASQQQIEQIGTREGWRVLRCNRGQFELIEFWIENKLMLELLPPAMASQYLAVLQPQNLKQLIEQAKRTTTVS